MDRQFWDLHDKDYWSEDEILYACGKFVTRSDGRHELFRKLQDCKDGKLVEDGAEAETDPGANEKFRDWFKEFLIVQYGELLHNSGLDPLSRIGILGSSRDSMYQPYGALSTNLWISWISPGVDGYVVGPKRAGKTSRMSLVSKLAIDKGMKVLGAVQLTHEIPGYLYCPNATILVRTLCVLKLQGNKLVLVDIDEAFIAWSGETPLAVKTMNLRKIARLFGKLEASTLMATQRFRELPSEMKKDAKFRVHCPSKRQPDRAIVELEGIIDGRLENWSGRVKHFPDGEPHTMPYKTEAMAAFTMDFDVGTLFDYLSELPMGANQFEATIRWLDDKGLQIKPREKRWFARRIVACGESQHFASKVVGVSVATVNKWVHEGEAESRVDEDMLGQT